jgi:medium-chain acyl-[acyl-carrier-protein] hydrolase
MDKYKKTYLIKSYECDFKVKLRVRSLFNLFQDIADEHAEKMGLGYTYCHERDIGWIGGGYHVAIHHWPTWGDIVEMSTWPSAATAATGIRDFSIVDTNGNILIQATSQWVLIDTNRMRPIPVLKHIPMYELLEERALESDFGKIVIPDTSAETHSFPVRIDDIDLNDHVNNALYPTWALDALSQDFLRSHILSEIQVSFKRPAYYRDLITIQTWYTSNETIHVMTNNDNTIEYARVRLVWKQGK